MLYIDICTIPIAEKPIKSLGTLFILQFKWLSNWISWWFGIDHHTVWSLSPFGWRGFQGRLSTGVPSNDVQTPSWTKSLTPIMISLLKVIRFVILDKYFVLKAHAYRSNAVIWKMKHVSLILSVCMIFFN